MQLQVFRLVPRSSFPGMMLLMCNLNATFDAGNATELILALFETRLVGPVGAVFAQIL